MDISPITTLPGAAASIKGVAQPDTIVAEFETMMYRTLLQSTQWLPVAGSGNRAEQGIFTGMLNEFFAQEAAKQQAGFGAFLLQTLVTQGEHHDR